MKIKPENLLIDIKFFIDAMRRLEAALQENDHRKIGAIIFEITDRLKYLYVGFGGSLDEISPAHNHHD